MNILIKLSLCRLLFKQYENPRWSARPRTWAKRRKTAISIKLTYTNNSKTHWHTKNFHKTFWAKILNKNIIFQWCMKFSFTCFKKKEQDFHQSSSRPLWTWHFDRKIFSLKQIYAEKESDANGNFKQYSGTDIFMKWAYFNSAWKSLSHASKK